MNDWALLRDYLDQGSEAAFEALVKRHVDMVYAAALRQLRDPHLAQDATQAVFVLLARKGTRLRSSVVLGGWLYRTATFVASRALRDRVRRHQKEKEALSMTVEPSTDELWETVAPQLDPAMSELGAADRNALVLRYLQQRSFREVAEAQGVSEDAAKKRVSRAVGKLRDKLARRTLGISAITLSALLTGKTAEAAPAAVVGAAIKAGVQAGALAAPAALTLAAKVARDWLLTRLIRGLGILGTASLVFFAVVRLENAQKPEASLASPDPAVAAANLPSQSEPVLSPASSAPTQTKPQGMKLKVVAAENGSPLPEAKIRVRFYGAKDITSDLATDAEGVAQIVRPQRRFEGMAIWVAAPGWVPKALSWNREEAPSLPSDYTLKLDAGIRVSGRVQDESQSPITGARVYFGSEGMRWNSREYVSYENRFTQPTTDERGEWVADFLASNPKVYGRMTHPDFAETEFHFELNGPTTNVVLTMLRGVPVSGVVLNSDAQPIPGARLAADWGHANRDELRAKADSTGHFLWPHAALGKLHLKVSARDYHPLEKWLDLSSEGLELELTLQPAKVAGSAILKGRVVDESGSPIPGIGVGLNDAQPALKDVQWSATTDDAGWFAWDQAPEGAVILSFNSWDYEPLHAVELRADGTEHLITMNPAKTIALGGKVTDRATGSEIQAFKVSQGESWPHPGADNRITDLRFLGEGTGGAFSFRIRPDRLAGHSPERESLLQIDAEGYLSEMVKLPKSADSDIQMEVAMQPANDITGTVLDPAGRVAAGAQVALLGQGLRVIMQEPGRFMVYNDSMVNVTRSATDGSFRLSPRPGAQRLAIVHEDGWAVVPIPSPFSGPTPLAPWARIEGVLRIGSGVGANQKVAVASGEGRPDTISLWYSTSSDESGRFHFDKVPGGVLRVFRYFESNPGGAGFTAQSQAQVVETRAGQTAQMTLGGQGVNVSGRLIAQPARNDILWRVAPQNLRPAAAKPKPGEVSPGYGFFCNEDGSFVIEDVPAGSYVLEVGAHVRNEHADDADFNTHSIGERKLDVVIPEGASGDFCLGEIAVTVKGD